VTSAQQTTLAVRTGHFRKTPLANKTRKRQMKALWGNLGGRNVIKSALNIINRKLFEWMLTGWTSGLLAERCQGDRKIDNMAEGETEDKILDSFSLSACVFNAP